MTKKSDAGAVELALLFVESDSSLLNALQSRL